MKIAFIGAGNVGGALSVRLAAAGHDVVLGRANEGSKSVDATLARSSRLVAQPVADAVRAAEIVFLATPFGAVEQAIRPLASLLADKVLVDCTNPVGPGLSHGLRSERSGSEVVQASAPAARVVKAFTIYGFENFDDPAYPGYDVKPAMLFCGDEPSAKETVAKLVSDLGFDPLDVGGLEQALHLEHMTLLWIKYARGGGRGPGLVWAALRR